MFANVVLDWSGTLCDDLPPVLETINRILAHYEADPVDEALFRAEFELPFDRFYQDRIPQASADELEACYRKYFPLSDQRATGLPHLHAFLEGRKEEGCRMFILSAATPSHFERQAEELGVRSYFESCHTGVRDKRDVLGQLLVEKRLAREETCFIGDMRHDMETAHGAGVTAIAVLTGYDSAAKLEGARPDLMVRDLERMDALFRRFRKEMKA
ncbi:MAG: HAD-IA family hydrolase [Verrucomicrobiota bacterium]